MSIGADLCPEYPFLNAKTCYTGDMQGICPVKSNLRDITEAVRKRPWSRMNLMIRLQCLLFYILAICVSFDASAATLPPHHPLRILVVSDAVNPHGLSDSELTQPGDISAALQALDAGLVLDDSPDSVREIETNDIDLATAALSLPFGDPNAYDVLIYFAHRIPNDDSAGQNAADQAAFVTAVENFLIASSSCGKA